MQAEAAATASRTPPAVVEIMESDHHSFMLKKMGGWVASWRQHAWRLVQVLLWLLRKM